MNLHRISKAYIPGVIILLLMCLVVLFQIKHDTISPPFTTKLPTATRDLLPAHILPYITFGFTNFITDIYWLRAVQDLTAWDGKDLFYLNYFKNISALDPTFEYPHLFNILVVPQRNDVNVLNAIAKIADEGIATIPTSWKIPFYLGTQYYLFTKEYEPATHYLGIAASRKDAPDGVYLMYSTFVAKRVPKGIHSQADYETVQKLVKVIYSNTDNETIKKIASSGLQENAINHMLEKGIVAYKEKYKRYPKNAHEMEVVHFTSLPQEFLDNFDIEINPVNGYFKLKEKDLN